MLIASNWNYHERKEGSEGVISEWIKTSHLSNKSQAKMDRSLDQLKQLPKTSWSRPHASSLGNSIYVIRFKDVNGTQLRVFGHFFDDHKAFVMTFEGYEKDNVYYPSTYPKMAQRHKADCDKDFSNKTIKFGNYCALCKPQNVASNP